MDGAVEHFVNDLNPALDCARLFPVNTDHGDNDPTVELPMLAPIDHN